MNELGKRPFTPKITIMVDYGMAPFLWLIKEPDQQGIGDFMCDGCDYDDSFPMSEGLWRKFADWAIAFDETQFYWDNFDASDWDWIAFHARGIHLSHWLKEEVGSDYRVIYQKPGEDPNHRVNSRQEILANGALVTINDLIDPIPEPQHFCKLIISGGQTGVDRAALDFAIEQGISHGGWAPMGRIAEDGMIPLMYQLLELKHGGYRQRTKMNVQNSDGTLILNIGQLEGGTLKTQEFAKNLEKPCLVVKLEQVQLANEVAKVSDWLRENKIHTLNIAGPREGKHPGIYSQTFNFLLLLEQIKIE